MYFSLILNHITKLLNESNILTDILKTSPVSKIFKIIQQQDP